MAVVPAQRPIRGDRSMFSSSDDNAMMKRILETHAPDGRDVDAKPLLQIIEDIFKRAAPGSIQVSNYWSLLLFNIQSSILCSNKYSIKSMGFLGIILKSRNICFIYVCRPGRYIYILYYLVSDYL
jgi:hypothetical protein